MHRTLDQECQLVLTRGDYRVYRRATP
jgi:hypothetical protein